MASGSVGGADREELLRAERDALARRLAEAERRVKELTAELAALRDQLGRAEKAAPLSLFDGVDPDGATGMSRDGSDPRVVPLVLGAIAVVAAMVTFLAFLNGTLASPFGVVMIALTVGLAYAASRTRVPSVRISVRNGVLYAEQRGATYRFDLRSDSTHIEVVGEPGDAYWQVRFLRRHLDPFVVDADMVDPKAFMAQLREYRPSL